MRATRQELADILKISVETIKRLTRQDKLKERLEDKGYKLNLITKEGRNNYYDIELINKSKEDFSNMCKETFRTENQEGFANYFIERTENTDNIVSKKEIANKAKVCLNTVNKWDKIMINNNLIAKDGYAYFKIERNPLGEREVSQCSRKEYSEFWHSKAMLKVYKQLEDEYNSGKIDTQELIQLSMEKALMLDIIRDTFYYKINRYRLGENQELYIEVRDLIYDVFKK